MNTWFSVLSAVIVCLLPAVKLSADPVSTDPASADPAEGYWLSVDHKTEQVTASWHIYEENGRLMGRMVALAGYPQDMPAFTCRESYPGFPLPGKVNEMPFIGTPWIYGLRREREGYWSGGRIIDPNDGNIYTCRITFHAPDGRRYRVETLEMRAAFGIIGVSQYWRRSTEEEASALR